MKIVILGGGPAGLYCALLLKKAHPLYEITLLERNPADMTYGWGVVFSDRTLASFQRADWKTYEEITNHFVIWDAIDVSYRDARIRCGGHVIASISRQRLLSILQSRCTELGVELQFEHEVRSLETLPEHDLLIAADGLHSLVRTSFSEVFRPRISTGRARYIWLGAHKVLDAFTFLFRENEHGLFQVHAYPFSGTTSTFIVECDEESWLRAGLDQADEAASLAYCEELLKADLAGTHLLSNNSRWISFPTLKTTVWHHKKMVLLGDAVHTAHFSIGSGTKLAMEDAISLAAALEHMEQHGDLEAALSEYEAERKPVVEVFQRAARESQGYFESIKRYLGLEPMQFAFQLLTRSGRVSYDDLRLRDARFGDEVDRWFASHTSSAARALFAPSPLFAPLSLRSLTLPNRLALMAPSCTERPEEQAAVYTRLASGGAGLLVSDFVAVSPAGRISPDSSGLYEPEQVEAWSAASAAVHGSSSARLALLLGHAGRRGATRPRRDGLDRPLREGGWPLLSASALPYTAASQVPNAMEQDDMEQVCEEFVRAARMALSAQIDLLLLHFGHGYLLGSFLSPLSNRREDAYGGDFERRLRYPLEVFTAVREVWPQERPLAVALSITDGAKGGVSIDEGVASARALREHGCDLIMVLAGQTTPTSEAPYGRGFLTPLSDHVRNRAGIPTLVGGYLTSSNEVNTLLAAGRADLCLLSSM